MLDVVAKTAVGDLLAQYFVIFVATRRETWCQGASYKYYRLGIL